MKKIQRLALLLVLSLNVLVAISDQTQIYQLGDAAESTDILSVICQDTANTASVFFHIYSSLPKGSPSGLVVSAEIFGGTNTITVTDSSSSDKLYSRDLEIPAKGLVILVNKNKTGKVNYTIESHCWSASHVHLDTNITRQSK